MSNPRKWTLDKIQAEAIKYVRRADFQKGNSGAYISARRQGLLDAVCAHMQLPATRRYTDEEIERIAMQFKTRSEFAKNSKAYAAAFLRGMDFVNKVCSHMTSVKKVQKHTKETAAIDALKYKTRREFCVNDAGSYLAAVKNGWINEICQHMEARRIPAPLMEEIKEAALKYNSRGEWDSKDRRTYNQARKLKCLNEVCQHMVGGGKSGPETEILKMLKPYFPSVMSKVFKNKNPLYPLRRYELDFYIPEIKKGVEFDGKYWHSLEVLSKRPSLTLDQAKTYHEDKDAFFKTLDIEVFHIKEEDWYFNKDKIKKDLADFLGQFFGTSMNRTRHYRRQLPETIKEIQEELESSNV